MDNIERHFEELTDVWRMYKRHAGIRNDRKADPKWDALLEDAKKIQDRHGNTKFIMSLVMLVLELLEDEAKEADT